MSEPILDVLRRLREDARVKSAPDALEEKLIVAFREHHATRGRVGHNWFWTSAAIAASLLVMFAWRTSSTTSLPLAPKPPEVRGGSKLVELDPVVPVASTHTKPKIRRQRTQNRPKAASAPLERKKEFIRLPYAPEFDPFEGGQVVRISVPGASVRDLGFPVMLDRVQAEVLLGGDGVARAIRLVSNVGLNSEGR